MRSALVRMFLLLLVGCTPAAPPMTPAPPLPEPPASATTPPPPPPAPAPDPFAVPEDLKSEPIAVAIPDEAPPPLPTVRKDVRGPDRSCNAWAKRRKGKAPACKERSEALTALERALGEGDTEKRDVALAGLEECTGLPAGLIRALRAELAPTECADVLAEPALSKSPKGISNAVLQVLAGHVLAGRLARLGGDMPTMKPPYEKEKILEHVKGPLAKWLIVQTSAIEEASQTGAKLQGYARALVAVEAGIADMRLVDSIRTVPVPQEWDEELKGVYQSALEEAMEPRKQRGRDAALLGLGGMGALGVIEDLRLARVRAFLTKLYQGRRIDALDGLLLPAAGSEGKTVEQRLAARLPTFYATQLLDAGAMTEADALRAWLKRGLPVALRAALKGGALTPEQRKLVVQARMALGQRYWRRFDFDEMIALVGKEKERSEEETLLLATALALRGGPENAADMMLRPPSMSLGVLDVAALDQVARSSSRLAPMAA
ncbi:MAG: hypothetical protein NZX77_14840, partial [Polyangiaceae bacterium]|nr:hypothetical protein [Polyangiaceae bacterium]